MRQHPKWLRQRPLRESVGRIALVINRNRRLKALVFEVEIKIVDIFREEHALIDQRLVAERANVKARNARFTGAAFNTAAANI